MDPHVPGAFVSDDTSTTMSDDSAWSTGSLPGSVYTALASSARSLASWTALPFTAVCSRVHMALFGNAITTVTDNSQVPPMKHNDNDGVDGKESDGGTST